MSLFSRFAERRALTPTSGFAEAFSPQGQTWAGNTVSQQNALRLSAVYTCVSLIADSVASLPTDIVETVGDRRRAIAAPSWLRNPNPWDSQFDFWHKVMSSLLMDGNAFIHVHYGPNGGVVALVPLDPRQVRVELTEDKAGVVFKIEDKTFTPAEIIHVKGFSTADNLRGLSPLEMARQTIGLGLATEEFGATFFAAGGTMTGVIEHPGKATPGEVAMISTMMQKSPKVKRRHSIGILSGGATFRPITVAPEQAQFLESQQFNRTNIAALYRVPAYMLDPTTASSWGTGVEEQHNWFVQQTLMPWLVRLEQAFAAILAPDETLTFNVNARIRVKTMDRYQAHEIGLRAGFLTVSEVRELEDREPLPNGDSSGIPPATGELAGS